MAKAKPTVTTDQSIRPGTTRRDFVRIATAALPAIALPAVAQAAVSTCLAAAHPDAALFALAEKLDVAGRRADTALEPFTRAEEAMGVWARHNPKPYKGVPGGKWVNEMKRWNASYAAAQAKCRLEEAEANWNAATDEVAELCGDIMETPARTLEGLACKARLYVFDDNLAHSVVGDLLEMQGFVLPISAPRSYGGPR